MESASLSVSRAGSRHRPAARQLLGFNVIWAVALAIGGYALGHWLGSHIGANSAAQTETDQDDVAILMGLGLSIVGWMAGLGFFNYPLGRIMGRPATLREREEHGAWRYFRLCTDHKVVAIQYLVAVLFFFFVAGLNAMFIRTELTSANATLIPAGNYLTLVGLHGTMMLMMMSAGVLGPLGNYLVPLMIGARRMAFPRIESLTMWLTVLAGFVLLSATLLGGFPTGWTGYAPLADQARGGHRRLHRLLRADRDRARPRRREHARHRHDAARSRDALESPADLRLGDGDHGDPRGPRGSGAPGRADHGGLRPHR